MQYKCHLVEICVPPYLIPRGTWNEVQTHSVALVLQVGVHSNDTYCTYISTQWSVQEDKMKQAYLIELAAEGSAMACTLFCLLANNVDGLMSEFRLLLLVVLAWLTCKRIRIVLRGSLPYARLGLFWWWRTCRVFTPESTRGMGQQDVRSNELEWTS